MSPPRCQKEENDAKKSKRLIQSVGSALPSLSLARSLRLMARSSRVIPHHGTTRSDFDLDQSEIVDPSLLT
jgi:hypothetical protein